MPGEPEKKEILNTSETEKTNELNTATEASKTERKEKSEESKKDSGQYSVGKKAPKSIERELKFEWDAVHAEMYYVWRSFKRELIGFWDPVEILILLILLILFAFALLGLTVAVLPIIIDITLGSATKENFNNSVSSFWKGSGARTFFAACGGVMWLIRQMRKSEFAKFARKVNPMKNMTYVFGTSPYAEQVVFHTIKRLAFEERIAIIADRDLLWVQGAKSKCPSYVVNDLEEFSKSNLYERLKFQNADRIFILTENVEINQDILTGVRLWTDAEVVMLSQFAPGFLQHIDAKEQNITIIEDLKANIEDLVFSLSLNMDMPLGGAVEGPAPRCYIGLPAEMMNLNPNLKRFSILGIRRRDQILNSWEILQEGDYVIMVSGHNTNLKRTIRIGHELSSRFSRFEIFTISFFGFIFFLLGYFLSGMIL
jgi:hypothetical protein